MKLNLGCGDKLMPGYVNVDICGSPDLICDLSKFPWPFEDNSVEEVFAEHFLEHVDDYDKTVREINRILSPRGRLHFVVPHFRSSWYPWHLHRYQFSTITCRLLCTELKYQFDGRKLFDLENILLRYKYNGRLLNSVFSFFANIFPYRWDYFGLPIDEIDCCCLKA